MRPVSLGESIGAPNRLSFNPEFRYSQCWGECVLDGYFGVWSSATNPEFWTRNIDCAGTRSQSRNPIGSFEAAEPKLQAGALGFSLRKFLVRRDNTGSQSCTRAMLLSITDAYSKLIDQDNS